ncbi:MAG: hypothetical protein Q9166_002113 [cf. Caloplaca sp. 2 TL-2023]
MDPLSITTGVLTMIGACNALASTIRKLHHLREAPKELGELEREMSALQSCTKVINQLVQTQCENRSDLIGRISVGMCVKNARQKIEEIQHFLDHTLLDLSTSSKIRRTAWLRWQSDFSRLRQELRDVRSEIGTCICLFSAVESQENETRLRKMAIEGQALHECHLKTLEAIRQEVAAQRPALAAEMGMQLKLMNQTMQATTLGESPSVMLQSARRRSPYGSSPEFDGRLLQTSMERPRSHPEGNSTVLEVHDETAGDISTTSQSVIATRPVSGRCLAADEAIGGSQTTSMSARHEPVVSLQICHRQISQCRRPCSCQCHRASKLKTPDFLRHITGQLLVGYAGISSLTPPCNEHACAKRQQTAVRLQYNFPVWSLVQRALTLVSCSGGAYGPEKTLRMSRIRPGLDEVFIQVQSGNVRRLQQLFVQGDASPLDASDTGWTLLHYALSAGQLPTVKFLKDAGADDRAESTSRETPVDVAWNRILSGCLDERSEDLLRMVFDDDTQLDERQFTTLHKIVLGMIGKNLADELEVTTSHINAKDSSGNTPLAWASARGDHGSVVVLLEHGASIDIANDVNAEPIHLAAQTGNIPTIRQLVRAGADVSSVVRLTQMTPIHYAAEYQDSTEQIHGLADLGAEIDGKDYLNWTPLHWASWRGHLASLNALLNCGADVNAKTLDGNASIMLAVANNSYECVKRLIEAGADCSVVRDSQWNILHYAAIGGSVDTLRSLKEANLSGIDLEELRTKDTGQNVSEMLSARLQALSTAEDHPETLEKWKLAWNNLIIALNAKNEAHVGPDIDRRLLRSDTDSIYVDADDQPFEHRDEP